MMEAHQVADGVFGRADPADALTDTVFFVQNDALGRVSRMGASGGSLSLMTADEQAWQLPG